jgi:hypothetical protein
MKSITIIITVNCSDEIVSHTYKILEEGKIFNVRKNE